MNIRKRFIGLTKKKDTKMIQLRSRSETMQATHKSCSSCKTAVASDAFDTSSVSLSLRSSETRSRRRRRGVTFSLEVTVYDSLSRYDMSRKETRDTWYTDRDLLLMETELASNILTFTRTRRPSPMLAEQDQVIKFATLTPKGQARKQRTIARAQYAVLECQARQGYHGSKSDEAIARTYKKTCSQASRNAQARARVLELNVTQKKHERR